MSKENLERVAAEIKAALDAATTNDKTNEEASFIDGDAFKQIARPLRRALRLIEGKPRPQTEAEKEAEQLFELMHSEDHRVVYEVGCVLDEFINGAARVYYSKQHFIPMYIEARAEGTDARVSAILRAIKQGVTPQEIARQLEAGTLK